MRPDPLRADCNYTGELVKDLIRKNPGLLSEKWKEYV